jgi:hypothetical protein
VVAGGQRARAAARRDAARFQRAVGFIASDNHTEASKPAAQFQPIKGVPTDRS